VFFSAATAVLKAVLGVGSSPSFERAARQRKVQASGEEMLLFIVEGVRSFSYPRTESTKDIVKNQIFPSVCSGGSPTEERAVSIRSPDLLPG